tara:strand:- start:169 stop:798 length:630 start_codon:yes stop_codon:yes gene_type:complete
MNCLILLRHGQSEWNLENKFTGLTDISLTEEGRSEAAKAGRLINKLSLKIDYLYSSVLFRANETAEIAIKETDQKEDFISGNLKMIKNEALNERDYGELVGLNKSETTKKFGEKQVHIWRRSYDIPPPSGESLKNVLERVDPFYQKNIMLNIQDQKNVLVVAHGNSLRAMLICLKLYKPENISKIEIETGKPLVVYYKNNELIEWKKLH